MGNISELFQPLEDTIRKRFLPALTGRKPPSDDERAVLALPARLGGLGIRNLVQNAIAEHENSMKATKPLTELIVDQVAGIGNIKDELLRLRQATHVANRDRATTAAKQLAAKLPAAQSRSLTLASEKGASSWVTALPLSCHGFVLHIARNAIATYTKIFFLLSLNDFFFQPQHAASEGLWSLPTRCLSRSFPENVLNKHTFGTMALKGEEISSAKNQTLLVKVQQPLGKTPESRAPETSPHVWPIQNVCLPQHISPFFYPFRWSQLIGPSLSEASVRRSTSPLS